ncbi:MAG: aminoacyl-tRNA deacylase [Candidatus Bipolaricaulia bacterium]
MTIAAKLQSFLDEHQVRYHVLKHHETYTAQEIAAALHVPGKELAKVVIVKADDNYIMVVLPAHYRVDLRTLAQALGAKQAGLAIEEEFQGLFPDCDLGAMPPFGNLYGLPVYVDRSLSEDVEIVFEAGSHQEAIKMAYSDFEQLVQPKILSFGTPS